MVTVHCSDTPNNQDITSEAINRFHIQSRGWDRIGYHFVIHRNGDIDSRHNKTFFRGLNEPGAHVEGHNDGNLGVCLVGQTKFTLEQFYAFETLFTGLRQSLNLKYSDLYCHNEFTNQKTCPNMRSGPLVAFLLTGKVEHIVQYIR